MTSSIRSTARPGPGASSCWRPAPRRRPSRSRPAAAQPASSSAAAPASGGKVTLTFWSWVPGISQSVNLWNKSHPDIHVNLNEVTSGNAGTYAKMFSALQAGNAPDLGQVEYATLPNFEHVGGLVDLSKYGAGSVKQDFVPWTWSQVTQGSAVYAIPQDTGPMGLFYRADLFKKYGLTVPTTWAQYLSDAKKLHAANPNAYIAAFPANDAQWFSGPRLAGRGEVVQHLGRHLGRRHRRHALHAGRQLLAAADQRSPGEGRAGLRLGVVQGPVRRHPAHLADRGLGREHPGHQRRPDQGRLAGGRRCRTGAPRPATATGAARPRWCSRTASTRPRPRSSPSG